MKLFEREPEVIVTVKTFVDGVYVGETAKVIRNGFIDLVSWPVVVAMIPLGLWLMTMKSGMF